MVTGRELLWDLFRLVMTVLIWAGGLPVALLTLLRFVAEDRLWPVGMWVNFAPYCYALVIPLLVLGIISRLWKSTLFLVVLLVIGGLWFGPMVFNSPQVAPAGEGITPVRVITYTPDRALAVYEDFRRWATDSQADIIAIQDFRLMNGRGLVDRAAADYPYTSWVMPGWQPTSGNLVLSRYPILEQSAVVEGDFVLRNFVTRLVLEINGEPIALYNVDMARSYNRDNPRFRLPPLDPLINRFITGYDAAARNNGVDRLREVLTAETLPYIVVGNFGFTPMHRAYERLAALMADSHRDAGRGMANTWPVGLGARIPTLVQFDYIWHSIGRFQAASSSLGQQLDSRRLPLITDLRLLPAAPQ
jgi:endonuclease/exonuclease/phosphatase (EEP) superfamily protein YafD